MKYIFSDKPYEKLKIIVHTLDITLMGFSNFSYESVNNMRKKLHQIHTFYTQQNPFSLHPILKHHTLNILERIEVFRAFLKKNESNIDYPVKTYKPKKEIIIETKSVEERIRESMQKHEDIKNRIDQLDLDIKNISNDRDERNKTLTSLIQLEKISQIDMNDKNCTVCNDKRLCGIMRRIVLFRTLLNEKTQSEKDEEEILNRLDYTYQDETKYLFILYFRNNHIHEVERGIHHSYTEKFISTLSSYIEQYEEAHLPPDSDEIFFFETGESRKQL